MTELLLDDVDRHSLCRKLGGVGVTQAVGSSTTSTIPGWRPSISPPGFGGRAGRSWGRSSSWPARSAATARASWRRSGLGLSNGRLEGLNSRVRLISHRSFGFHGAPPLIALVYLCCGGVTVAPPLA